MNHITIIGDGAMGTVLALMLHARGAQVCVWGVSARSIDDMIQARENRRYLPGHPLPDAIQLTADPDAAFRGTELALNATPTQYIRDVWTRLAPHLPPGLPIASVAKGIETDTLLRPTQIIADVLAPPPADPGRAAHPLAAVSGPTVAHELALCLPATVCAASDDPGFARSLQSTLTTDWLRVYTNFDLIGVELAGALKNVIALAAGILDGLEAGNNAKSALLARGLAEITRLGMAMGARQETFFGVAGVGDLATTCFSPTGRNRSCGELLGRGRSLDEALAEIHGVVEGVPTTRSVVLLAEKHRVDMPITQAIHAVLFEGLDPREGITRLMARDPKPERVG